MYRTAATTNKALTNEEALQRIERLQKGRAPQDVMSLGLSFVRAPIMPKDFQKSLSQITKWNRFQIDELYDRVCLACGKQAMKMYIDALFYLKTQNLCWNANVDAAKIRITIPDYASFIHLITIHLARLLWELPGILEPATDYEQEYRRKDQFDHLVFQAVRLALAEKIPMSDILDQLSYSDHPMHHISSDMPYAPPPPELITMPPIQQQPLRQMHPIVPMQNGMPPPERFDPIMANHPQQPTNVPILSEPPIRLLDEPRREEIVLPPAPTMTALPFEETVAVPTPIANNDANGLSSNSSALPPPPPNPIESARRHQSQHHDDENDEEGSGDDDDDDGEEDADDDESDEEDEPGDHPQPFFHPNEHSEQQEPNNNDNRLGTNEPIKVHIV